MIAQSQQLRGKSKTKEEVEEAHYQVYQDFKKLKELLPNMSGTKLAAELRSRNLTTYARSTVLGIVALFEEKERMKTS